MLRRLYDRIGLTEAALVALTLGLAPFTPEPHVWEKLRLLAQGALVRPLDWFDLVLHGLPWLLLAAKVIEALRRRA
ncbi:MAG: RND transporter [Paracoccaceae bacterium]